MNKEVESRALKAGWGVLDREMNRVKNIKVLCCTLNKTFLPLLRFLRTEYSLKLLSGPCFLSVHVPLT